MEDARRLLRHRAEVLRLQYDQIHAQLEEIRHRLGRLRGH
jgi:hypothetical protein